MGAEDTGAWRFGVFRALGFDIDEAMLLAASREADTHRVADAIKNGCTTEQALRIFT